jgi:hypothetical protein
MTEPTVEILEAVREASSDGKISCARLRKLAEDMGVQYRVAGAAADKLDIRVKQCDLGCF